MATPGMRGSDPVWSPPPGFRFGSSRLSVADPADKIEMNLQGRS